MKILLNSLKLISQLIADLFKPTQIADNKQAAKSDADKIKFDWEKVGEDMQNAMNELDKKE